MKITKIETFKFWVDWCNWLLVRISTDDGVVGWGEASLHGAIESVEVLERSRALASAVFVHGATFVVADLF